MRKYSSPTITSVGDPRPDSCTAVAIVLAVALVFAGAFVAAAYQYALVNMVEYDGSTQSGVLCKQCC